MVHESRVRTRTRPRARFTQPFDRTNERELVHGLTWDVQQVPFVVVHHELDDDPGALAVVFQADDAHYVSQVLHV